MMKITAEQLSHMIPSNSEVDAWCDELNKAFEKYGINTPQRIAGFISQCAHESRDFTRLEENLNYSESALNRVFGRYFGEVSATLRSMLETLKRSQTMSTWMSTDLSEVR